MTAQDFLKIWFKIIGISGIFVFFIIVFQPPFVDENNSEIEFRISTKIVFTFIGIAINFAFLLPMLVIVVFSIYYFELGTNSKETNFKKVKLVFIITMILTALFTLFYVEDVLTTMLLMGMNTIIGIVLLNRFWSKYERERN
jgi:hypothetical protein